MYKLINRSFHILCKMNGLIDCCLTSFDLINRYEIYVSQMTTDMFRLS
jgi:hypothetical protein